jgi:ribosome-binding factor A
MSKRVDKINEAIKKEISLLLINGLKDNRIKTHTISVTSVKTTPDLDRAEVFVSIYDQDGNKQKTLDILNKAKGYFKSSISKKIRIHHTPDIIFKLDDSVEYGAKIDEIIANINKEKGNRND